MPRKLRVLALMDADLVPPDTIAGVSDEEMADWKMEYDVTATLSELGHEVQRLGVAELGQIADAQREFRPHVAFNMMEEFHGAATYEPHLVCHLELLRLPYTGCNPLGLMLSHDKAVSKRVLEGCGVPTPRSVVFPRRGAAPAAHGLSYPLLVKSTVEDASLGIGLDSVVRDRRQLQRRVRRVHRQQGSDALVEEYIEGREFYIGTLGNRRPTSLPVWELRFRRLPEGIPNIATADVKWDHQLQKKLGVYTCRARVTRQLEQRLGRLARQVHRLLGLSGYARMDFRVTPDGRPYVLEANPNPNLSFGEDYAESAEAGGISYEQLIQKILNQALAYRPAWKEQL